VGDVVDPFAGAYAIEALTAEIERRASALIGDIDAKGGMVAAIQAGFPQREIERRAFEHQRAVEERRRVIVGENELVEPEDPAHGSMALHRLDPALERDQIARLERFRAARDAGLVRQTLDALSTSAAMSESMSESISASAKATTSRTNLMSAILAAVKAGATLGEIADALRAVFGEHHG
jgi:methylmalonyl-CoA mutase N-terminal domain/subunit